MSVRLDALTLPLWGSRLIEASAGTGKTWTIAGLYLRLVLGHGSDETRFGAPLAPAQILVMTFTRAATRELSDRIRARLVEAAECFRGTRAVADDDALLGALVDAYPAGPVRQAAAWRLAMAAEAMDDAAVFTIDAWVQRMLREHAFDSGCLFDEEVQADELAMLDEAARDYWRQEVYPLDDGTLDAVLSVWPNVAALATDVQRLRPDLPEEPDDEVDGESLAILWVRLHAERARLLASLKEDWTIRAAKMRSWLLEQIALPDCPFIGARMRAAKVEEWTGRLERWAGDPAQAALGMTETAVFRLSPRGLTDALRPGRTVAIPAQFEAFPQLVAALSALPEPIHSIRLHAALRVERRLRTLKRRAGIYAFDDMLKRLDVALRGPAGERLRARIVAQYPVAMIDEFQDTSTVQYRVFDRLYVPAANDRSTALLLIGDPKQSIFAFRRADIRSYLRARGSMGDRHYVLDVNYRSTTALVAAVNRLFERAEGHPEGAFRFGATLPFVTVDARGRRDALVGAGGPVPALTLAHDAVLSSKSEAAHRFAEACAEHIVGALNDRGGGFDDPVDGFRKLEMSDVTVLVRDRHEAAAVRRALRRRGVASVYLSDQDSVFTTPEAADLLHWLNAVAEPTDGRRARVAFATALVGLSTDRLARLGHDDVAFEARLEDLRILNGVWRRQGVLPMLRRTLHLLDLPARWLRDADGERRLTNVLHLAELLQAAGATLDGEHALIRWLSEQVGRKRVAADDQIVRLESDADLVKVMTIWTAKGLEYPVVYVPFVCSYREPTPDGVTVDAADDGTRSLRFRVTDADKRRSLLESQQEEVRLLYVAMTRARHALWLGVAPLKVGTKRCAFNRSAFGYLVGGVHELAADAIAGQLQRVFADLPSVALVAVDAEAAATTPLRARERPPALVDAPDYAGVFERDWSIGSFSAFVRDLARVPMSATVVEPAVEEELLSAAGEDDAAIPSSAPRHRFPRGALPGNFLHDQLQWLAEHRFALPDDADLRAELARRCERDGWGHRAHDVVVWLGEVAVARLPPLGVALRDLVTILPEMEFWFPNDGIGARDIDRLCRRHLLGGRERPPLPDRTLRGMLMGFADLVFESGGRYWVLDYKSNALGAGDADYTSDALERSMAEHRYDVQAAIYLLALHRLLRQRLGADYDPARQLGGALYLFLRGIAGPVSGCYVVEPTVAWLDALDDALHAGAVERP